MKFPFMKTMEISLKKWLLALIAPSCLVSMLTACTDRPAFHTDRAMPPVVVRPAEPIRFAPYYAGRSHTNVESWMNETGNKFLTLAFYNSGGACTGRWQQDNETKLIAIAEMLRSRGGQVIVSSGGWNAFDIAAECTDPAKIADLYDGVLARLRTDYLDLDAEPGDVHDNLLPEVVDRRSAAVKLLQERFAARGKTLHVSLTIAIRPAFGFDARNFYVLQSAKKAGLDFEVVNPMIMDYRDGTSGPEMGPRSILALEKGESQLQSLLPGRTDAQYWSMMAATAMIGQNDAEPEIFTLEDARKLVAFAQLKGMARLSFWSVDRDNGTCAGAQIANPACSGIPQETWAFSRIFGAY